MHHFQLAKMPLDLQETVDWLAKIKIYWDRVEGLYPNNSALMLGQLRILLGSFRDLQSVLIEDPIGRGQGELYFII